MEAIEHECEIDIGNAPLAEQAFLVAGKQCLRDGKEFLRGTLASGESCDCLDPKNTTSVERSCLIGTRSLRSHA